MTSAIKIFVKYPEDGRHFIQKILESAAFNAQSPDVRDRAFIYWRMLSTDPQKTRNIVLCPKPAIEERTEVYEDAFLQNMIDTLGCVSSVYSLPAD